jgi:hypothetical protein
MSESSIQKIKNMFRLDVWWGRVVFMTLLYLVFWWIFFGAWLLIPFSWFSAVVMKVKGVARYYIFGFVPLLSLFIPYIVRKCMSFKRVYLYPLHLILIALSILFFFVFAFLEVSSNYQFLPKF